MCTVQDKCDKEFLILMSECVRVSDPTNIFMFSAITHRRRLFPGKDGFIMLIQEFKLGYTHQPTYPRAVVVRVEGIENREGSTRDSR